MNRLAVLALLLTAVAAPAQTSPLRIVLGQRTGESVATRAGLAHAGGGVIDVGQPRPDGVVVTMSGLTAVGGLPCETSAAVVAFDVCQHFWVVHDRGDTRPVRLIAEAQLSGMMRANREGAGLAATDPAEAVVAASGSPPLLAVGFPGRALSGHQIRFVNDRQEPTAALLPPGEYTLTQRFAVRCDHPKRPFHKNVVISAFGGESSRMPEWLSILDPNRDLPKGRALGFQVTLRVEPANP